MNTEIQMLVGRLRDQGFIVEDEF